MTLDDVKALLGQGESSQLEFKKSLSQLKPAMESLCAFLNTKGGYVIFGVGSSANIIGQHVTDATQQEIANHIAKIEPFPSFVDVRYIPLEGDKGLMLVVISTKRGDQGPYAYDGRAFYRNQSTTMRMPQARYKELLKAQSEKRILPWDKQYLDQASLDDLDIDAIRQTIKVAVHANRLDAEALNEPVEDILMRLGVLNEGRLTHAAMVLFVKANHPHFCFCSIKMARFQGTTEAGGFIDNQIVQGNAFYVMKSANEFLMKHLPVASFFAEDKLERIDKPPIPVLAIREALSNAICHKDYAMHNSAITLAIFDDRMEVWNNGTLPVPLTLADLRVKHKSYPRNEKIAQVFYLRRYVETWGTGTTRMIDLCREHGVPDPVFEEYSGGFSVTFAFKESVERFLGCSESDEEPVRPKERQEGILALIETSGPLSSRQIHTKLGANISFRALKTDLLMLKNQGVIRQVGRGKNTVWAGFGQDLGRIRAN